MKKIAILFFLIIFSFTAFAQSPTPKKSITKLTKSTPKKIVSEKEEFEKAVALTDAAERVGALQKFIQNFPKSKEIVRAQELIVSARAELGEQKLQAGETAAGVDLFKLAVKDAPAPLSDELFAKVVLGFPLNLYVRGQRDAAFEVARMIEEKSSSNAKQLLDLSKFFINIEYGTKAIELAKKAVQLAPDLPLAYQTLGIATRLNFQLEDSANAFAKALELNGESVSDKRNLADMKRALGKTDEAAALYREILAKDSADLGAQTGLTLSLFDSDKKSEAEEELKKSLEAEPKNAALLVGAAYWYVAHNESAKAVEYGQKAVAINPTYPWAYVAIARGYMNQKQPLEAERVLLTAKQYGDFPTLDYELASARLAAGFYREAAESLKKNFAVNKDGLIETYLGNRILADAKTFTELLSLERKAVLFEPLAADSAENAQRLKALLEFSQKIDAAEINETEIAQAADEFARGDDNMRLHRQLFVANTLLQKKTALPKVLELTQAAIGGVDAALDVPAPAAAVLADELYESRTISISRNQIVIVPDISRQTLSAILRGRIEEITGWALYQQNNTAQSVIRLKRALSVLPEKSAWWRSSMWRLGAALEADGKQKEALDIYIKVYDKDAPDPKRRVVIEALYQKVNGSLDGLDAKIGAKPESPVIAVSESNKTETRNTDNVKQAARPTPSPEIKPEISPTPKAEETPPTTEVKPEIKTETQPTPQILPVATPEKTPEVLPQPKPEAPKVEETPKPSPENSVNPTPEVSPKTETTPSPKPTETPTAEIQPTVTPTPETAPTVMATPETSPTPESSPKTEVTPTQVTETKPEPITEVSPTPQNVSETKTEITPQVSPSPEKTDLKTENRSVVIIDNLPKSETQPLNTPKPLFEPVVISVPKTEAVKTDKTETKPTDENQTETLRKTEAETAQKTETQTTEKPNPENKLAETVTADKPPTGETVKDDKTAAATDLSGETRQRLTVFVTDTTKTTSEEVKPCRIVSSQESLSLLNGGGSLGLFVGFEGEGDIRQITAVSSSPGDVEVSLEVGIGESSGRAFFIIKSVTDKTGAFNVTFGAPCGKKEILVKVR